MTELERLAELNKPIQPNPAHLLTPTRCKVLKPFMVRGERVEVGQVVELRFADARDMIALKKAELVKPSEGER